MRPATCETHGLENCSTCGKAPMTPTTIGENELRAILDGLEGVTPGPWEKDTNPTTDFLYGTGRKGSMHIGSIPSKHDRDYLARLDPDTVRSIVTELLELRRKDGLGTVSVKPMEWVKSGPNNWSASTPFGDYHIERDGIPARDVGLYFPLTFKVGFISENISTYNSTSAVAKASAEAHHQARVKSCLTSIGVEAGHPDDLAVDRFAAAMKAKLAEKRLEGRGGWELKDECSAEHLSVMLRNHVEKGDPLDVGNFAMMLHQRGDRITS